MISLLSRCVLAELFLEGQPLFELSQLLAYRRGQYDPLHTLEKVFLLFLAPLDSSLFVLNYFRVGIFVIEKLGLASLVFISDSLYILVSPWVSAQLLLVVGPMILVFREIGPTIRSIQSCSLFPECTCIIIVVPKHMQQMTTWAFCSKFIACNTFLDWKV